MSDEAQRTVRELLRGIPDCDRVIVIYPDGDESGCRWLGMSAEQVVNTLYQVADEILRQRVPLKKQN